MSADDELKKLIQAIQGYEKDDMLKAIFEKLTDNKEIPKKIKVEITNLSSHLSLGKKIDKKIIAAGAILFLTGLLLLILAPHFIPASLDLLKAGLGVLGYVAVCCSLPIIATGVARKRLASTPKNKAITLAHSMFSKESSSASEVLARTKEFA